ncbi:hypothetical protein SH1V18_11510 [Vallitalea longa]|uniref:Uncharacterized protein n=1 Tax=Vallitalea longa TaxID=2936439 RepID=A0A9W5Y9N7_9FIRM|nr:hypothetical protein [Vallitalea longa]GKX28671.1 hypothetical protein SH1V18_11510 [Vallitalea longa]
MKEEYNEAIELFFSSLDDSMMEEIIDIYESGDKEKLNVYLDNLSIDVPKKELIECLSKINEMKFMMREFD